MPLTKTGKNNTVRRKVDNILLSDLVTSSVLFFTMDQTSTTDGMNLLRKWN